MREWLGAGNAADDFEVEAFLLALDHRRHGRHGDVELAGDQRCHAGPTAGRWGHGDLEPFLGEVVLRLGDEERAGIQHRNHADA